MVALLECLLFIASSMTRRQLVQRFGFIGGLFHFKLSLNPQRIFSVVPGDNSPGSGRSL